MDGRRRNHMGDPCPSIILFHTTTVACWLNLLRGVVMIVIRPTTTIDEVVEMLRSLTAIATQVIDDVDSAVKTNDLSLLLDRMVANAEDLQNVLDSQQQVAQNTRQGEAL